MFFILKGEKPGTCALLAESDDQIGKCVSSCHDDSDCKDAKKCVS